ncbi:MAG: hypothetical protein UY24_C0012G0002 [Parcubacteria group bacterium GW2011_GWA1_48_11b]|nr:MAG: hypothetical protein UY24_C0012G0002 [Parcubacteria group bacterium GW2011_GWA1_48_11b]
MASLIFGGGANEVGASHKVYVFDDGTVFAIDCGLRPTGFDSDISCLFDGKLNGSQDSKNQLDPSSIEAFPTCQTSPDMDIVPLVDFLLLTHGHFDHVGAVIYLVKKNPRIIIYATAPTREFCKFHWFTTIDLAERKKLEPPYSPADVELALSRMMIIAPSVGVAVNPVKVNDNLSFIPISAGHTLGAVSCFLVYKNEAVGFDTGDISFADTRTVQAAPRLKWNDGLRFMVVDSTRIGETNPPRKKTEAECIETVRNAFAEGKFIRFLTYAIGRSQEAYELAREACPDAPIFIDGAAREISEVFLQNNAMSSDAAKHFVGDKKERFQIINGIKPNIVIAPSAMRFGGCARLYAEEGISRSNHLFISLGYLDPHSPEYSFFESEKGSVFKFGPDAIPRFCDAERLNLTGHCDGNDVLETKDRMKPEMTILNHGDNAKMEKFIAEHPGEGFVKSENGKELKLF